MKKSLKVLLISTMLAFPIYNFTSIEDHHGTITVKEQHPDY